MPDDLGYPALGWYGLDATLTGGVLRQVAPPSVEPIVLAEAKAHLRVESTVEDALIQGWIQAARQHVEAYTRRALLPQDWELRLGGFSGRRGAIELPLPPFISLLSVSTYGTAGAVTVLPLDGIQVDAPSGDLAGPAEISPGAAAMWPSVATGLRGAVRIRFRAGYASPGAVPQPLRSAVLLMVGEFYANREAASTLTITANPVFERLLDHYRVGARL